MRFFAHRQFYIVMKEDFLFLTHDVHDPYFNLASEEYLLRHKSEYFVYLWINSPAVIVGVNQNTLEEVNLDFTQRTGIKVVRRQTGGGAVYHDQNNICYTVIAPYDDTQNNYEKFSKPVINYLKSLGLNAEFTGRNDIVVDGKKVSGNAQTVYKDRIMHHGTLLFDTDITVLGDALKPNKLKIESKGIKSVRSRVANIRDLLTEKITIAEFFEGLKDYLKKDYKEYLLGETDVTAIEKLVDEKYSRYEWNVGRSPIGKNEFADRFDFGTFKINFDTVDGIMQNTIITGDFFSLKPINEFCEKLNGTVFDKIALQNIFNQIDEYILNANGKQVLERIFN